MVPAQTKCERCGKDHPLVTCPYVKAVEFSADNSHILRVEFLTPIDFPRQQIAETGPDYPKLKPVGS